MYRLTAGVAERVVSKKPTPRSVMIGDDVGVSA